MTSLKIASIGLAVLLISLVFIRGDWPGKLIGLPLLAMFYGGLVAAVGGLVFYFFVDLRHDAAPTDSGPRRCVYETAPFDVSDEEGGSEACTMRVYEGCGIEDPTEPLYVVMQCGPDMGCVPVHCSTGVNRAILVADLMYKNNR